MRLAVFCLARPTFDVDLAAETAQAAVASLRKAGAEVLGDATLLLDAEAVTQRLEALKDQPLDGVLIVQATFCDAAMTATIGGTLAAPIAIWAFPEPRDGGRLRLNSFCGLSLASHALGKIGRRCGWFHAPANEALDLGALFGQAGTAPATRPAKSGGEAVPFASRIGLVGEHPAGFDTCGFDQNDLKARFNVDVERIDLKDFFSAAESAETARIDQLRNDAAGRLEGLGGLDGDQVDKSLRCYAALRDMADSRRLDGFAVRCWPETFTEYGCAVCGAMATLNGERIPASCEADMLGTLGSRLLQDLADAPAMLTDIVDVDAGDDTAVLWHCGLAPLDFCDPDVAPRATIHTNRRMPLLHEFPMKPGRVTVARISQAQSEMKMVIGRGEILKRPMSFTGTSGVIRFDCGAAAARRVLIDAQLEHHVSLVYGDVKAGLEAAAAAAGLPVLDLDEAR
ncbi:L-fucose/L-arabinose isomerase family protein [Pelagibius sp.]|uniref:L-fucose/L-arabinose isomerase family protein n=1 Tax=Pelagibius sp. TaxID=1931238 RepID=UPI002637BD7F|nr:hypothetical protein [Pelagibius sp.]